MSIISRLHFPLALIVALFSGCASQGDSMVLRLAEQAAVYEGVAAYVDGDIDRSDRSERVRDVTADLVNQIDAGIVAAVPAVEAALRSQIPWHTLAPHRAALVDALITEMAARLERRVESREIDSEKLLPVRQVLIWAQQAASIGATGARIPTQIQ